MLVLMRDEDAVARSLRRYATIAGWGYSSDGKGGITRPEADGHQLALRRAYDAAGFGIDTVAYLEGHGTGTAVGDATELRAFSEARRAADPTAAPAAISTIKGNIGHTKAAAGVAGLLKAILAVRHQVIPPATGHVDPHPELTGDRPALRVPRTAELWPAGAPVRAGVSSMGFGGINAHVVVEQADGPRRVALRHDASNVSSRSRQDCELLLFDAADIAELRGRIAQLGRVGGPAVLRRTGRPRRDPAGRTGRPSVARGRGGPLARRRRSSGWRQLLSLLDNGVRARCWTSPEGSSSATRGGHPRIGFLFPGQGAGRRGDGGALRYRFETVDELYRAAALPADGDLVATAVAQPQDRHLVASPGCGSCADWASTAVAAAGHSLGELTALHWAGAMDEAAVLAAAAARGRIMAAASEGGGTMAGIAAPPERRAAAAGRRARGDRRLQRSTADGRVRAGGRGRPGLCPGRGARSHRRCG